MPHPIVRSIESRRLDSGVRVHGFNGIDGWQQVEVNHTSQPLRVDAYESRLRIARGESTTLNTGGGGGGGGAGTSELRAVLSQRERFRLRDVKQALKEAAGVEEEAGSMDEFLRGEGGGRLASLVPLHLFVHSFDTIHLIHSFVCFLRSYLLALGLSCEVILYYFNAWFIPRPRTVFFGREMYETYE